MIDRAPDWRLRRALARARAEGRINGECRCQVCGLRHRLQDQATDCCTALMPYCEYSTKRIIQADDEGVVDPQEVDRHLAAVEAMDADRRRRRDTVWRTLTNSPPDTHGGNE